MQLADIAVLGLTRAEAAFAVEFANGHSLRTCADRLGVSVTTAKTHLQRIFDKTGACRQADLMRLILTSTPALCHDCENCTEAAE
jgi:DNA-binding CsgD family transcriptional regulator